MFIRAIFFLCLIPSLAWANPLPNQSLSKATEQQIIAAENAQTSCESSNTNRTNFDCVCIGAQSLFLLRKFKADTLDYSMVERVEKLCPNTIDLAGQSFQRCMRWTMLNLRTQKNFCECFANTYAKNFTANPTTRMAGRERMMTSALNSCNIGTAVENWDARDKRVKDLKKQGEYQRLFLGAPEPIDDPLKP